MTQEPKKPGFSGRRDLTFTWSPRTDLDLSNHRVAVVGGTNGLGRAIARVMADRGAHVVVVGQTFRDEKTPRIEFVKADLSSMREARRVGQTLPAEGLDLVVLTTGIIAAPARQVTDEGLERDLAVSFLSRLALLRELAPRLGTRRSSDAPPPRVFVMGFPGTGEAGDVADLNYERRYTAMSAHAQTVAGNEALVLDAVSRYPQVLTFGLNPGLIKTDIRANLLQRGSLRHRVVEGLIGLLMISPETYAARIVSLLVAPELEQRSGAMFNQKAQAILPSEVLTAERVHRFIVSSEALVARALAHGPTLGPTSR